MVVSAVVAIGIELADPIIGLAITLVIPQITIDSWRMIRGSETSAAHPPARV